MKIKGIKKTILNLFGFVLIYLILIVPIGNVNKAYATELKNNNANKFLAAESFSTPKLPVISIETILKIADKNIGKNDRIQETEILLCKQPFDIQNEYQKARIVSYDESLIVSDGSVVYSEKEGFYNLTIFSPEKGMIDYTFDIRECEDKNEVHLNVVVGKEMQIDIKNLDLATYNVSDESVVSVSNDGIITAKKRGQAVVTVEINSFQKILYYINTRPTFKEYSEEELRLICAIVQQECATSYDGALAVISCAYNRSITPSYINTIGGDPLSQLKGKNQFCYSLDDKWKRYLSDGAIYSYVKEAVQDCLFLGITNHDFLSFRGFKIDGATNFDGNYYFNEMPN